MLIRRSVSWNKRSRAIQGIWMPCYCWLETNANRPQRVGNRTARACCDKSGTKARGTASGYGLRGAGPFGRCCRGPSGAGTPCAQGSPAICRIRADLSPSKKNMMRRDKKFEKAAQLDPNNVALVDQLVELDLQQKRFDAARQRDTKSFSGKG